MTSACTHLEAASFLVQFNYFNLDCSIISDPPCRRMNLRKEDLIVILLDEAPDRKTVRFILHIDTFEHGKTNCAGGSLK